jgi:type IV secretion system protein VirD4
MVSRQDTARPLLTPGEVMQLPSTDELVLVSGLPPIRAKKARYFADQRFASRIHPAPALPLPSAGTCGDRSAIDADDWSTIPVLEPEGAAGRGGSVAASLEQQLVWSSHEMSSFQDLEPEAEFALLDEDTDARRERSGRNRSGTQS